MINPNDNRLKVAEQSKPKVWKRGKDNEQGGKQVSKLNAVNIRHVEAGRTALFFEHNLELGPPYHVILDTNFINFSIQYKMDIFNSMMDALLAKVIPCITDCAVAELEKMGHRYRLALKLTKDPRFKRLTCLHKGTYADDCIVDKVKGDRCYIVATNDKDLKRRIRKVPGVPIMYLSGHKYAIEKMSSDLGNF